MMKKEFNHITFVKIIDETPITFSSDIELLKHAVKDGPVVQLISMDNSLIANANESVSTFAMLLHDENGRNYSIDELQDMADDVYCKKVISRYYKKPFEIARTKRLVISELSLEDSARIINIYNDKEASLYIEKFFEEEMDASFWLEKYINEVYEFYDYGLWGLYYKGILIGIAGFTPRDTEDELEEIQKKIIVSGGGGTMDLELGYVIDREYRRQGFALEACLEIVDYAKKNLDYNSIVSYIYSDNTAGINLADSIIMNLEQKN